MLGDMGDGRLMIEAASLPKMLFEQIVASGVQTCEADCPLTIEKARKTPAELRGFCAAHQRDGVAMVEFLCWLDQAASAPTANITESDLSDKLLAFRQKQDGFLVPS